MIPRSTVFTQRSNIFFTGMRKRGEQLIQRAEQYITVNIHESNTCWLDSTRELKTNKRIYVGNILISLRTFWEGLEYFLSNLRLKCDEEDTLNSCSNWFSVISSPGNERWFLGLVKQISQCIKSVNERVDEERGKNRSAIKRGFFSNRVCNFQIAVEDYISDFKRFLNSLESEIAPILELQAQESLIDFYHEIQIIDDSLRFFRDDIDAVSYMEEGAKVLRMQIRGFIMVCDHINNDAFQDKELVNRLHSAHKETERQIEIIRRFKREDRPTKGKHSIFSEEHLQKVFKGIVDDIDDIRDIKDIDDIEEDARYTIRNPQSLLTQIEAKRVR